MSKNSRFLPLFLGVVLGGFNPADVQVSAKGKNNFAEDFSARLKAAGIFDGTRPAAYPSMKARRIAAKKKLAKAAGKAGTPGKTAAKATVKATVFGAGTAGAPSVVNPVTTVGEPLAEPVPETVAQPFVRPVAQTTEIPTAVPVSEPVAKHAPQTFAKVVSEPFVPPVAKPVEKPVVAVVPSARRSLAVPAFPVVENASFDRADDDDITAVRCAPLMPPGMPAAAPVISEAPKPAQAAVRKAPAERTPVSKPPAAKATLRTPPAEARVAAAKMPVAPPPEPEPVFPAPRKFIVPRHHSPASRPLLRETPKVPVVVDAKGNRVTSILLTPKKENSLRNLSTLKVSLEFKDVAVADLVQLMAAKANMNIVSKKPILGQTTVNFQDIPIGVALDTVLKNNGYSYELVDGVVWVFQADQEPLETRLFFLKYAMAIDVLPVVETYLRQFDLQKSPDGRSESDASPSEGGARKTEPAPGGGGTLAPASGGSSGAGNSAGGAPGGSPGQGSAGSGELAGGSGNVSTARVSRDGRWSIQVDERSNSLFVLAPRSKLEQIPRLLETFDVPIDSRRMQEQIFKLKYIDRNTIIRAIQMVLPRFDPGRQMVEVQRVDSGAAGGSSGSAGGGTGGTGGTGGGSAPTTGAGR